MEHVSSQPLFTMLRFSNTVAELLLFLGVRTLVAHAFPSGVKERASDTVYNVDGVGMFTSHAVYTFADNVWPPDGLRASDNEAIRDQNHGAPYNHIFLSSNVFVADGYLQIKVPGSQTPSTAQNNPITAQNSISAGEVSTTDAGILYGSVRTTATFSTVPGTVQGSFFYKSDTQEVDIEYLSDPNSTANTGGQPAIHWTNQPTNGGSSTTSLTRAPSDVDTVEHEYRIDWTSEFTTFYLDGVLQEKYTVNVPSNPGTWLWNNWANGDPTWSVGPPAQDSVMKVSKIEMYYNSTSTAGS